MVLNVRVVVKLDESTKDVIKWSKMKALHKAIGSASEDDVCSVVQNINDELGKFVDNPDISVCWKVLPCGPEKSKTEDSTVDSAHYLDQSKPT